MNDLLVQTPQFIARSVIQTMLHQALISDNGRPCMGLLCASADGLTIQDIVLVNQPQPLAGVMKKIQTKGLECAGFFYKKNEKPSEEFLSELPGFHTELCVNLDEAGRLDLLAFQKDKGNDTNLEITLILIEDGQLEADA
ncbi:MAG: hypothetical protein R8M46_06910 [Ghiorsea sp.]